MKKTSTFTHLLLSVVVVAAIGCGQPSENVFREQDRIRIAEAFIIAESYCEKVWPGWNEVPLSLIFLTKDHEYLIHHPNPTDDFNLLGFDSLLQADVLFRARIFPEKLLAAFQAVNNESSILMGTPEITERHSSAWVITLLHEHFHQLQYFQPGYFDKSKALELDRGDSTAMWMLNFDFPYDDPEVAERFHDLSNHLLQLLIEPDNTGKEAMIAYKVEKESFRELIGDDNYRYMQFQAWQEGVALYTEWKLLEILKTSNYQASPAFIELPDYMPFNELQQSIYDRIVSQLKNMDMQAWKRVSFYAFGAGEALLLDQTKPGWKQHYFENMFELDI
jgi:hypothetical protein